MPSSDCCSRLSLPGRSRQTAQPTARAEYGCGGLQRPSVIGSRTERFSLLLPARSFSCVVVWRRDGRRAALWLSTGGLLWLVSFGLHYLISVRYTHNSTYLRSTWITEILPLSLGLTGSVRWFLDRLEPLALNPGGTALAMTLWISAICGWAFGVKRPLGLVFAGVPLSAFAFAAVVPLHQRFSLWMAPALYAGVALLIDRAVALGSHAFARRRWTLLAVAMVVLLVPFRLCADIVTRGRLHLDARRHSTA